MRQLRETLRQKLLLGRSNRQIAASVRISSGSVSGAITRARAIGLDWATIEALSDRELEERLYGPTGGARNRPMPDPVQMHVELRKPGVTLQLLHLEYLEQHPTDGYRYTTFCGIYGEWLAKQRPSMRQVHEAGDKMFVDYSGARPHFIDPDTGQVVAVELFVAVLGASNYTYAEATRSQQGEDWIASHVRALEFFGGAPRGIVPDQLKSGVTRSCLYEPEIQRTYEELAIHYGTTVLPARPRRPRDKAKVEVAVQVAQRWILARLRHRSFFSLVELNAAIAELLADLNARVMRGYGASRRELFERADRSALHPLPQDRFVFGRWKLGATVHIDYHVEIDGHYYSVPTL